MVLDSSRTRVGFGTFKYSSLLTTENASDAVERFTPNREWAMKYLILQFLKQEDGPTAVEYAVMLALVVMGCLGTIMALGNATASSFENTQNQINNAMGSSSSP